MCLEPMGTEFGCFCVKREFITQKMFHVKQIVVFMGIL
ncbi:hypothetical protein B4088_3350 [Bacillus cereus]|uniref:Uncharacterized protein n=1 Tax=Bacillus cereus TaxID=1396 RepID=A0A164ND26_BACCE|nr:hypothetical protein B4088_3350 [Bacillus cereus]